MTRSVTSVTRAPTAAIVHQTHTGTLETAALSMEGNGKLNRASSRPGVARPWPTPLPVGSAHYLLPPDGTTGHPCIDRERVPGVQRRTPVRGVPDLLGQDAGTRERHHDRSHDRRRDDAGRTGRLR